MEAWIDGLQQGILTYCLLQAGQLMRIPRGIKKAKQDARVILPCRYCTPLFQWPFFRMNLEGRTSCIYIYISMERYV